MRISNYSFYENGANNDFQLLASSLGTTAIKNTIQIPLADGTGRIRKIDFEKGLHVRVWELKLTKPFQFDYHALENTTELSYTIVYLLSPHTVTLSAAIPLKESRLHQDMNIILLSNNTSISFRTQPGKEVKAVEVTITEEWMKEQFPEDDTVFNVFVDVMKNNRDPFQYPDRTSADEFRMASDLHTHALTGNKGFLHLKSKTFALVADFITQTFTHSRTFSESNSLHQEKMMKVEKFLEEHLEKELPSLEIIAREATLSQSTLKRHFKLMFGKSLYEYYLEKKMEHAKQLLLESPVTVKEVAYRLGYEKPSNFIQMFKKVHSYSPGRLRKNIA
ncbi:MAG TPA: AraC family transcriptional regulator [Chitinophagaceae bacterium]